MKKMKKWLLNFFAILVLLLSVYFTGTWSELFVDFQHAYFSLQNFGQKETKSQILDVEFFSPTLQSERKLAIYLPADYDKSQERYPVLYLLHGDPGDEQDWVVNADIQNVLDTLVAQGKIPRVIVVFPDGNGPNVSDGQYLNSASQHQALEDYLAADVVEYIDSQYRTLPNRESRAIGGNSSGGFGAINIALHHPEEFSTILLESAYFVLPNDSCKELLGKKTALCALNSPLQYLAKARLPEDFFIYLNYGSEDDDYIFQENKEMAVALKKQMVTFFDQQTPGAHGWGMWNENIAEALTQTLSRLSTE
jgi:enterochelin esterase-like enzyme